MVHPACTHPADFCHLACKCLHEPYGRSLADEQMCTSLLPCNAMTMLRSMHSSCLPDFHTAPSSCWRKRRCKKVCQTQTGLKHDHHDSECCAMRKQWGVQSVCWALCRRAVGRTYPWLWSLHMLELLLQTCWRRGTL